jgi:hypothetical protein
MKPFLIYDFKIDPSFLINEENFVFFFYQCANVQHVTFHHTDVAHVPLRRKGIEVNIAKIIFFLYLHLLVLKIIYSCLELFESHGQDVPSGVLLLRLLWQALRQLPFLPGGWIPLL